MGVGVCVAFVGVCCRSRSTGAEALDRSRAFEREPERRLDAMVMGRPPTVPTATNSRVETAQGAFRY